MCSIHPIIECMDWPQQPIEILYFTLTNINPSQSVSLPLPTGYAYDLS